MVLSLSNKERHPPLPTYRGVEQLVARRAHNPEVAGSSPVSATKKHSPPDGWAVLLRYGGGVGFRSPGYETDERSSLGFAATRCQWQMKRGRKYRSGQKMRGRLSPKQFLGTARRRGAITRRSQVQVLSPQPYRVDVTDFSYIHLFFMPSLRNRLSCAIIKDDWRCSYEDRCLY